MDRAKSFASCSWDYPEACQLRSAQTFADAAQDFHAPSRRVQSGQQKQDGRKRSGRALTG